MRFREIVLQGLKPKRSSVNFINGEVWGIITARGGSKSIPLKNLVPVAGRPLVQYVIEAAKRATSINRIICSTDSEKISDVAKTFGIDVTERPAHLAGDMVNTIDVLLNLMQTINEAERLLPEIIVLLQPTSLFVTSSQIDITVSALMDNPNAKSSQTVIKVPHQFHAHNQRHVLDNGNDVAFVYEKERAKGYNKQTKPVYYAPGNLIVTRTEALLKTGTIFGRPSVPIVIPPITAYDLDGPEDLTFAELIIKHKLVDVE